MYFILAGNNLVAGGALIAAAASPLWAGLLVGKKRKRRSETSAHLNEIPVDQKPLNWHAKMIQNYIQQQGELYRKRQWYIYYLIIMLTNTFLKNVTNFTYVKIYWSYA